MKTNLLLAAATLSLGSAQAVLVVTNGEMTNDAAAGGSANGTMAGWSNNVSGGFEAKATAGPDHFGALVFDVSTDGTSVGTTNNDWSGTTAGDVITLNFDLFNERLADGNGATDVLAELLIDGVAVDSLTLTRAGNGFDDTTDRTNYSLGGYTVQAGDIGQQVDVKFSATAADQGWHQTGVDNVALTTTTVPEPSGLSLFGLASLGVLLRRRR